MNKIRNSFFVAGAALALASSGLHAQTSIQRIGISLVGEYQTNTFYTNAAYPDGPWTSEFAYIRPVLVTTANVIRAMAVDMLGTNYTIWNGSELVREVNLTNGSEGIFLRKGNNQTNVSSFFGGSYSNNFMAGLSNAFPALTNNISGLSTNVYPTTNTPIPQTLLYHGWLRRPDPTDTTNTTNDFVSTGGLYFISFNTTNIKFNLVAVGDGSVTKVTGHVDGTLYETNIDSEYLGTAGTFYLNTASNIYDTGTNLPTYYTGPMRGTFNTGKPSFSTIPGP
jgi:hypothetical protein